MQDDFDLAKPIFMQIAEVIEDAILTGAFGEEEKIPSITELSVNYKINPATALKGVNILVDSGIVYKKRGLGMFVKNGAVDVLRQKRKDEFFEGYISRMIEEAKKLHLSEEDIKSMIERGFAK